MKKLGEFHGHFIKHVPHQPSVYLGLLIIWAVSLWFLSAWEKPAHDGPEIPHLDKVLHFLYFFGGGGLLSLSIGLKWKAWNPSTIFLLSASLMCVIGRLDEYHQSFIPGRSGNDLGDWIADTLGGAAGAWLMILFLLNPLKRDYKKSVDFLDCRE